MKRIFLFSLCFILVFLVSVLIHVPVSFAIKYLPPIQGLEFNGIGGTVWQGNAKNIVWKNQNLGQVVWDFQPGKLMEGKAEFSLRFGRGSDLNFTGKGNVGISISGPYAESVVASVPASQILQKVNVPVPVSADGRVELSIHEYRYAAPWCQSANGTLVWNASEINSPLGNLNLGALIADVNCSDNKLMASGNQETKQVAGAFNAQLDANKVYKMDAWFKPNSEFPAGMKSQLKWLGNPNAEGRYPFVYTGKLR